MTVLSSDDPVRVVQRFATLDAASNAFFGKPIAFMGEGGTIPFMAMLGERFPSAQFLITGVLGPHLMRYSHRRYKSDEILTLYRKFLVEMDRLVNAIDEMRVS